MTWKFALPMYNVSPRLLHGHEALLLALADETGVRAELVRPADLPAFWRQPDVLLTQTCGYPYLTQLRGHVTLLATPCFDFPGCEGSDYSSFIVAREGGGIRSLADARGRVAAVNDPDSNSGMNVLRHAVAPWSQDGRYFESVKWSGSHAASLRMVREGAAAIASIDCVSFAYLLQEDPASVQGVTILQQSARSPGLPWVASSKASPELTARLRAALLEPAPALRALCDGLRIRGFEQRSDADYGRILQIEAEARAAGYPDLA
ncbi:phosphate/phosphite/phosphonate ABC transporter substrate-binding protein [Duganella violaceipulchra]|uniref:ABC-type phosphate/phosphonate transport system substrate-binding protein n=1 Tax=Duganella violaceipulchra TaxID=2849652 RepID=A0AA41HDF7_9BURK|nr:PhnD/SsuA/transferrin family substrate-binding protein [Duganella violaceicalia]MBV6324586.1 PhnD/SsuA/transferrin family substrate-binding protein [Duganella violaceicalia]MCP2009294.1 ABC-type phosphate/phosphonate transport system substrate-binding protein [Duganella violaceicalia]